MPHHAQCQCGQLSVTASAEPEMMTTCSCTQCQRRTGSAFTWGVFFRRDVFTVTGTAKSWTRDTHDGRTLTNYFCAECGTNVYWEPDLRPEHVGVAGGCVTTELPEPGSTIFTSEKQPWVTFPDHWPRFKRSVAEG